MNVPKSKKPTLKTIGYRKHAIGILIIALVAIIGVIILTSSHAASPYSTAEASNGTLTGAATAETDSNASNGKYVKFGTAGSSGSGGSSSSGGCEYNGIVAPCVGGPTTGLAGWGDPSYDDEFNNNLSADTSTWNNEDGWTNQNGVTVSASNESEANGDLILTLASSSSGYQTQTSSYALPVGGFAEARIDFPGSGQTIYNWPAWWVSGPNWPSAGESDIAEGLGSLTENYHSPSGAHNHGQPSCTPNCVWSNSFHTYGIYRASNYVDVYWDGTLYYSYSTDDNGQPESLILTNGCSGGCTDGAKMLVDYVRAWNSNNSNPVWTGTKP